MKEIGLAVLCIGLCFYQVHLFVQVTKLKKDHSVTDSDGRDWMAASVAFVCAIVLIFS